MSMPSFPNIDPPIQREDAVNQILSSIAIYFGHSAGPQRSARHGQRRAGR